jgi:nucleoside 2-deoxyribosyltransferase
MWRRFRDAGCQITSSWIDEDGQGQTASFTDLWERIMKEIAEADYLVLYAKPDDFPLKGALVEVGIALGMKRPVIVCLPDVEVDSRNFRPIGSWIALSLVERNDNINNVMYKLISK